MSNKQRIKREPYNPLLKSFPDSEKINSVSEGAEVLYLRLIAACDDAGRYWAEPKMVLAKLFTHRAINGQVTIRGVDKRLSELERIGLIRFYRSDGKRYLEMVRVFKRLRPDLAVHLFCPEPADGPGECRNAPDDAGLPGVVRKIDAARRSVGSGEAPGFLAEKPADTPCASSRRRHDVGPSSLPSRPANPIQSDPIQPNPTHINPNAAHLDAAVTAHPTNVAASLSSSGRGIVVSDLSPRMPNVAGFASSKHARREPVMEHEPAAQVAAQFAAWSALEHAGENPARGASPGLPPALRPPLPTAVSPPAGSASEFEAFWNAYPFRNGRKADEHQARCLFGRLAQTDVPQCIEAARNYARETQATKRIPKDPHNFLTDDYWRSWVGPPATERSTRYVDPNSEEAQTWSAE